MDYSKVRGLSCPPTPQGLGQLTQLSSTSAALLLRIAFNVMLIRHCKICIFKTKVLHTLGLNSNQEVYLPRCK